MRLSTIRQTLINFVGNPNESWGEPTDGWGNPASINSGKVVRVSVEQADRNTARLNSGTYTREQSADFDHQLMEIEQSGSGTAFFPGDPNNLPDTVPERTCAQCDETFRSVKTDEPVKCYNCVLDRLCPPLPGRHITCRWHRDDWSMEAFGDIGFHNELTFWWSNSNSGGNVCHQGLAVRRNQEGVILKMVFSTVASSANCCYDITFDLEANTIGYASRNRRTVNLNDEYAKRTALEELEDIVLDLVVAMLPSWMVFTHRPRNPANGCFAVV